METIIKLKIPNSINIAYKDCVVDRCFILTKYYTLKQPNKPPYTKRHLSHCVKKQSLDNSYKISLMVGTILKLAFTILSLIHLFTALPDLKQTRIKELNTMLYNFIWSRKVNKIKRNTLICDYIHGGLKMVHLSSFIAHLKIS
ncbi:hypothetical protein KUTeg_006343 [Tegillarca granosa]|uniref:Uncharacterized protein n=1 Tax=Tegillarca granosa TaxID=220873 RepID=A0ABQ9FG88_TEGGR|nr:hypothetical protein KUTeg_006343 [Tegillarca granosa]